MVVYCVTWFNCYLLVLFEWLLGLIVLVLFDFSCAGWFVCFCGNCCGFVYCVWV